MTTKNTKAKTTVSSNESIDKKENTEKKELTEVEQMQLHLNNIDKACAMYNGTRQDHEALKVSLNVIANKLSEIYKEKTE